MKLPFKRVLFVDDHPLALVFLIPSLEKLGLEIQIARSLSEAATKLRKAEHEFGAIILDLLMPVAEGLGHTGIYSPFNGLEFYAELGKFLNNVHVPVAILTHSDDKRIDDAVASIEVTLPEPLKAPVFRHRLGHDFMTLWQGFVIGWYWRYRVSIKLKAFLDTIQRCDPRTAPFADIEKLCREFKEIASRSIE